MGNGDDRMCAISARVIDAPASFVVCHCPCILHRTMHNGIDCATQSFTWVMTPYDTSCRTSY